MRRIAVLTSGGDASGMNAAVRSVVCLSAEGHPGVLVGLLGGAVSTTPLTEIVSNRKSLDLGLLKLANVLAQ